MSLLPGDRLTIKDSLTGYLYPEKEAQEANIAHCQASAI